MKPFLKWAGGKSRIAPWICSQMPSGGTRYIEPFLGSASVFLGLEKKYDSYELSDINHDLIHLYQRLTADGSKFVRRVEALFEASPSLELYTAIRQEFNSLDATVNSERRCALFVWLNKHAFNGICRYNSSGGFNVPWNKVVDSDEQAKPSCPSKAMMEFHQRCSGGMVTFRQHSFEEAFAGAGTGDVIYCDPPYLPLKKDVAGFTDYAREGFGMKEQHRLAEMAVQAARDGARVVISNHDVPDARTLYVGATLVQHEVRRSVSASGQKRGKVGEILAVWGKE